MPVGVGVGAIGIVAGGTYSKKVTAAWHFLLPFFDVVVVRTWSVNYILLIFDDPDDEPWSYFPGHFNYNT